MLKQKGQESSSPSGTKPYGRTLRSTAKVNYIDADSQVLPDSVRVVDHRVIVEASKGASTYGTQTVCVAPVNVPKLQGPNNTWIVDGESLEFLSKAQVVGRLGTLVHQCDHRQQVFTTAIQRFEMYNQFFASACANTHPDGTSDVIATLRAVKNMGNELFVPRRDYTVSVTLFRHFVANLLHRLHSTSAVKHKNTALFNDLSHEYEDRENAIRLSLSNVAANVNGDPKKNLEMYMKAFKQRVEVLKSQQMTLDILAKECLEEIDDGFAEI